MSMSQEPPFQLSFSNSNQLWPTSLAFSTACSEKAVSFVYELTLIPLLTASKLLSLNLRLSLHPGTLHNLLHSGISSA